MIARKGIDIRRLGVRLTAYLSLIGYFTFNGFSQHFQGELLLGKNIQISQTNKDSPHAEPHLVVNPNNSSMLITASMMYTGSREPDQIASYYSHDGGETWQESNFEKAVGYGVDPWLTYDESGTAYLVYLPGVVHRSTDGGKTWSEGVEISGTRNPYDFIKMTSSENYLYITASQNLRTSEGNRIGPISVVRVSKDLSQIEEPVQILPGNINYQIGAPINLGRTDSLLIPFYELSDVDDNILEHNRIWLSMTNDRAQSFLTPKMTGFEGADPVLYANTSVSKRLHLFWLGKAKESWLIHASHSEDLGVRWSKPVEVEDIQRRPGGAGILPVVAGTDDGKLGIIWPDYRTDSTNKEYGVYFTYSLDQGETWSKSRLISEKITSADTKGNEVIIKDTDRFVSNRFRAGGDYYGLVALSNNRFQAVWSDNKTGTLQLWTTRIQIEK